MEKGCFKKTFFILQLPKKAKSAIFWSEIHFFSHIYSSLRSQSFLSFKTFHLAHSKLVWALYIP